MCTMNFNSNNKYNPGWIKFSSKNLRTPGERTAGETFSFRTVFNKLITYENLSEFFCTNHINQEIIPFFENLKTRISNKLSVNFKRREISLNIFLKSVWLGMIGFMAYVHLINSIIMPSDCIIPLTYEQLVESQEEAFKFFIKLHDDIEILWVDQRNTSSKRTYSKRTFNQLSFEEIRKHSLKQILNANLYNNQNVWIYLELWLIKFRPNLYKMAAQFSIDGSLVVNSRFSSLLNKIGFLFFSGFLKHKKKIQETQQKEEQKI
ncbi:expressed protein [Phakopsora pachyrhizi]|uniref:Expressed protein n=1 Tax=Phakopsora pachyrhizi TaxID=170000 RepID=A0AAV0BDG0_PHAPC|nr:expressed protein [Phakopsora pachyrhizi]